MRILILGAAGMLGRALWQVLGADARLEIHGAVRSPAPGLGALGPRVLIEGVNALDDADLERAFDAARPDVVINAVGLIKQKDGIENPLEALPVNAMLPHRLARISAAHGARLILMSTDCVFDGAQGGYREADRCTATDLYGLSKYLGEIADQPHVLTLRTSIIGREGGSRHSLIEWFLHGLSPVQGFRGAIFSGLPTVVLAEVIRDFILPRPDLAGLFHLSADSINKYDLLRLTAEVYGHPRPIEPMDVPRIDRSLNSDRFRGLTGFQPAPWRDLLTRMRDLQG